MILLKVCVVTGGSKGIGKEIAKEFLKNGYAVVSTYNNTLPFEQGIDYVKCNVSRSEDILNFSKYTISNYGKVDVLVNNAGISISGLVQDNSEDDFDSLFDVNMKSVFLFSKAFIPSMISRKFGRIINISSMWGVNGAANESLYSASKGAVISYTKSLAKELGPSGITVNSICPGAIKTDMLNAYTKEDLEDLRQNTPVLRLGTPEDIAKLAYFLSTASFITGQIITADGGFSL